ncbi:MAG: ATP-binding protein [Azospirillaceae bacterium]|nr:ATP-binding protein [Azospirillaceae bacterium]
MVRVATSTLRRPSGSTIDALGVLNALPDSVVVVDKDREIRFVNHQALEFFEIGATALIGTPFAEQIPRDSQIFALIDQVERDGSTICQDGIVIETPRIGSHVVTVQVGPMGDLPNLILVMFHERSLARLIESQMIHRNAARSVTAMAAMLAHEVKNPLSGIRGAAQLLEQNASTEDQVLTRLICDETDRIVALVDRMEVFSDKRPLELSAVNIHLVLEHARKVAQTGFGRHVRFVEHYDPSLPAVRGNRDQLIQVFLNLIKNAVEAVPEQGGEIVLVTSYQHGMRMAIPGRDGRSHLPLLVSIQDNGDGIPEDLRPHLFDPFVTTKLNGSGLGLALVAKIIGDHGGAIDFESQPRRTIFKVSLPMYPDSELSAQEIARGA